MLNEIKYNLYNNVECYCKYMIAKRIICRYITIGIIKEAIYYLMYK